MMHHRAHAAAVAHNGVSEQNGVEVATGGGEVKRRPKKGVKRRKRPRGPFQLQLGMIEICVIIAIAAIFLVGLGMWIGHRLTRNRQRRRYDDDDPLPFNEKYMVPGSHPDVGDRSDRYVLFRQNYDESVKRDLDRSIEFTKELQKYHFDTFPMVASEGDQVEGSIPAPGYDIYNCPKTPPEGYPFAWSIMKVLNNWPTEDLKVRHQIHQGLCVFDFRHDYEKAMTYRKAELPFIVRHDPSVAQTVERWNTPGYMDGMLGNVKHRTEYSTNNHFMYSVPLPKNPRRANKKRNLKIPDNWKPPTELYRMPYRQWLDHANVTEPVGPNQPHWYFRLIGCGATGKHGNCDKGSSEYLFDELPFFQPKDTLYMVQPDEQKGIHCRFGMDGVIAENHFDGSRNSIAVLGGARRYLLSHPNQCQHLALYPKSHPSARHSQVDWTHPDLEQFPDFENAKVNEVVMQAGEVLYLPTHWFHYIVSLELNFQCNTRSGIAYDYEDIIRDCGFPT